MLTAALSTHDTVPIRLLSGDFYFDLVDEEAERRG